MTLNRDVTRAAALLQRIRSKGVEIENVAGPLRRALDESDATPLQAWAREQGEAHYNAGGALPQLLEHVLTLGQALEDVSIGDSQGVALTATLAGAAVQGFNDAAESRATQAGFRQLKSRVEEMTALHRIISAANSSLKLNDMLQETASAVVAVTNADICSIFLYEPEWDQLVLTATSAPAGADIRPSGPVRLQLGEGITGWAAMAGIPVAVRNMREDSRFKYIPATADDSATSLLAVPVVLFTIEKLVGVITVQTLNERDFSDNEIRFLETVAGEIAIAIENARLYEQTDARLRQKVAELTTLQGVSAHIAATLDLAAVLSLIAHQAAHLVHADAATIYELNSADGVLEQVAHYSLRDPRHNIYEARIGPNVTLDLERSEIARAVLHGIPTSLPPDADANLGIPVAAEEYRSLFCVPLVAPRGIMGAICLYTSSERTYTDEQIHLLDAFAHEAAVAIENSRLYDAALRGLQVKSAMLQEMNHRVRNNLQTVAGLLSMQLRRLKAESPAADALKESIARIQSMAAVHDFMTGSDVVSASLYDLAYKIGDATLSTLLKPSQQVKLVVDRENTESIRIDSHKATLLALLMNELVSNAVLHGFDGVNRGEIRIRAWEEETPETIAGRAGARMPPVVHIEVADTGIGLPEDFDLLHDANLGLNIVRTMVVSDLRGDFSITPPLKGRGTVAQLWFPNTHVSVAP